MAFALLFVAGTTATYFSTRPRPSVDEQITRAFQSAKVAAQKGDISGAVAVVSNRFKAGGVNKKRLRLLLFRARQEARGTDWVIDVAPPRVLPANPATPAERLVVTRIVARTGAGETLWSTGDSPVTLLMREEPGKTWGIFPRNDWRVVAAPGLPDF